MTRAAAWQRTARLLLACALVVPASTKCEAAARQQQSVLASGQTVRPAASYSYTDYAVIPDPRLVHAAAAAELGQQLCQCRAHGGSNQTVWLNTGAAIHNGKVHLVILQRQWVHRARTVTYLMPPVARHDQTLELNTLILCTVQQPGKLHRELGLQDCQVVVPGPGYAELHPLRHAYPYELVGLIDPRLISAGQDAGLFLQVGCRPRDMALLDMQPSFRETLCIVKLLPAAAAAATATTGQAASSKQEGRGQTMQVQRGLLTLGSDRAALSGSRKSMQQQQRQRAGAALSSGSLTAQNPKAWALASRLQQQQQQGAAAVGAQLQRVWSAAQWPARRLVPVVHEESGPQRFEKSWVPFVYQGALLWSRSLRPHQVVSMAPTGSAHTQYQSSSDAVLARLGHMCGKGPRGNTPALHLPRNVSGLPVEVYMGILHYTPFRSRKNKPRAARHAHGTGCGQYTNFFYLMEATPPFQLLEVAPAPIPLLAATNPLLDQPPLSWDMGYISFPSGLLLLDDNVIITYGSGDTQLRVWSAALADVLHTFTDVWLPR